MKGALITLVVALIVFGCFALPSGDGAGSDPASRFDPGRGDYPAHTPIAAGSELTPQKVACLTPDLRRPRPRIG